MYTYNYNNTVSSWSFSAEYGQRVYHIYNFNEILQCQIFHILLFNNSIYSCNCANKDNLNLDSFPLILVCDI